MIIPYALSQLQVAQNIGMELSPNVSYIQKKNIEKIDNIAKSLVGRQKKLLEPIALHTLHLIPTECDLARIWEGV